MIKPIVIYGAGGMGREIKTLIDHINVKNKEWEVIGFVDDHLKMGTVLNGIPVLGGKEFFAGKDIYAVVAVGSSYVRLSIVENLDHLIKFATLIHPSVIIGDKKTVKIGAGSILCAGCILTTDIIIRDHVLMNLSCTIGHDCSIDSFASLMPGVNVGGHVQIGLAAFVGSGATIINGKSIGESSITGAGAVVIRDVPPRAKVVGVPGKIIGTV